VENKILCYHCHKELVEKGKHFVCPEHGIMALKENVVLYKENEP